VPSSTGVAVATSEVGILKRELEKKRKHLPTRKLIESLPSLLPRLKPCFLMSPLSVVQYLDTKLPNFDLVIFDEASQIPVWDAIGALARGDESIVVGDSKQLPPTAFFATLDSEEEEPEPGVVEDLESILQECEASDVPSMRLKWHYRSRHESLIAFSNHHYYNNELHTFPSPADRSDSLGVTLRLFPNAVYDRGGSRQNRVEAEAVVQEVLRRLRLGKEHASIGVVTFGSPQQVLIEDLLDAARREHSEIEEFFSGSEEPVLVKSLENVQGDERDTIIFSIGYGRDQTGKTTMNFGPINQNGGERRLNVAITRARQQLIVFSSIRAEDIDLGRTQAVGVRHLKTFLDYAARGPKAIAEAVELTRNREFDSGFERAVYDALVERGWRIDTQVGCAGFRIDPAVVHPDLPGRYAIGIECDGASYHSAQTARDRDRLRAAVLKGLGWRLTRVWSTDWRIDRRRCVESIERAIKAALLDTPTELQKPEPAPPASVAPAPTEDRPSPPEDAREPDPTPPQPAPLPQYRMAQPPHRIPSEADIADPAYLDLAVECVAHIVAVEHPITPGVAVRRLAGWFGIQRIREKTEQRLHDVIRIASDRHLIRAFRDALWPEAANPVAYDAFRVPGSSDGERRDAEEIPLVERVAAARYVLLAHFGMPREDLEREVARVFGAQRLTPRIQAAVGQAVDALIGSGGAVAADGSVSLPPP
jgi:very-short-patch-repair endonuclease